MKNSNENLIFALDIGTRSVIGMIGYQDEDKFFVTDMEKVEYKHRVVIDGQIENIEETAKTALIVKNRLEDRLGFVLKDVYIAAAGRTLKTIEASGEIDFEEEVAIDDVIVSKVERVAIEKAYGEIRGTKLISEDKEYYCVGSSVQRYYLDDYKISTLLNHKGKKIGVDMIVTFLPKEVVESLYATMKCIDLNVAGLTLEPIAAMNCLIPEELRQLNVALCDIGAGTSDIAICKDGAVIGFTMVTVAGDEITEAIMKELIIDFQSAERIKSELADEKIDTIKYEDILGFEYECPKIDFYEKIKGNVEELASVISEKIIGLNGEVPAALFLVGGGSKTFGLRELVAEQTGLDAKRIAVGGNVYMKKLVEASDEIYSPEYTTPLGIMVTAAIYKKRDEFAIKVNNRVVRLANCWETSLLGILQMCGYRYNQIMSVSGSTLEYKINGKNVVVRGTIGEPAIVLVNGKNAMLTDVVESGDVIEFTEAKPGEMAVVTGADLKTLYGDNKDFVKEGQIIADDYVAKSGDEIFYLQDETTKIISLNDETIANEQFKEGDETLEEVVQDAPKKEKFISVVLNGKTIRLSEKVDGKKYNYFDILIYTDIDPKNPRGNIIQKINGKEATYLSEINDGDKIEIYWDEKKN